MAVKIFRLHLPLAYITGEGGQSMGSGSLPLPIGPES